MTDNILIDYFCNEGHTFDILFGKAENVRACMPCEECNQMALSLNVVPTYERDDIENWERKTPNAEFETWKKDWDERYV